MGSAASIVFIHGLQGHPEKTWAKQIDSRDSERLSTLNSLLGRRKKRDRSVSEKGAQSVFWPRDLLPLKYPKARILTYGYDSHISHFFKGPANQNGITEHGRDMLQALVAYRRTTLDKPIVFVAHSLGGLVLKEVSHDVLVVSCPEG